MSKMRCRECGSFNISYMTEHDEIDALVEFCHCNGCDRDFTAKAQSLRNNVRRGDILAKARGLVNNYTFRNNFG